MREIGEVTNEIRILAKQVERTAVKLEDPYTPDYTALLYHQAERILELKALVSWVEGYVDKQKRSL